MSYHQINTILCWAKQNDLYNIIRCSEHWPNIFEPCINVRALIKSDNYEHIEVTASVNGSEKTWESKRYFSPENYTVKSLIAMPMKYIKNMIAVWRILSLGNDKCAIVLEHEYEIARTIDEQSDEIKSPEEALYFMRKAIEDNSTRELINIKDAIESDVQIQNHAADVMSHSIVCNVKRDVAYALLRDMQCWPDFLDFCLAVDVIEKSENREIVKITGKMGEQESSWITLRQYNDDLYRIDFSVNNPMKSISNIQGDWIVVAIDNERCLICVDRNFEYNTQSDVEINALKKSIYTKAELELKLIREYLERDREVII